jgi:hypothetical protein
MALPSDAEIDEALATAQIKVPEAARLGVREAVRALARLADKLKAKP